MKMTSRRLTWLGHVTDKGYMIHAYALLTAKAEEIWEMQAEIKDNTAVDLKGKRFEGVNWFQLATGSGFVKGRELFEKLHNQQLLKDSAPWNWLRVLLFWQC
jgi:hypothetical protein